MVKIVEKGGKKINLFFLITNNLVQAPEITGKMKWNFFVKFQFLPARYRKMGKKCKNSRKNKLEVKKILKIFFYDSYKP